MLARADFVGFHMDGWQSAGKPEIVESWCFGAPRGSRFVRAWFAEFDAALRAHASLGDYGEAAARTLDLENFPAAFLGHLAVPKPRGTSQTWTGSLHARRGLPLRRSTSRPRRSCRSPAPTTRWR
mmetsp:Transcript_5170/g.15365  ORF Transcript_5170/g.15365 Transcript_5170/m.15365 type:complete len:125 (+) Transcript_5170:278-652(+)